MGLAINFLPTTRRSLLVRFQLILTLAIFDRGQRLKHLEMPLESLILIIGAIVLVTVTIIVMEAIWFRLP